MIVAQAGRLGAVTVATNMAGRGVDILLGGVEDGGSAGKAVRVELLVQLLPGQCGDGVSSDHARRTDDDHPM